MGHQPSDGETLGAVVDSVVATRRTIAVLQAQEARLLATALETAIARMDVAQGTPLARRAGSDLPLREITAELAAAMRLSDRTVQSRMGDALTLTTRFSATVTAWEAGSIDAAHVSAILDAGSAITDDQLRAQYEAAALRAAEFESPARLRATAKAQAAAIDPTSIEAQRSAALDRRGVRLLDLDDGLSRILADVPATLGHAILDRLTEMVKVVREGGGADPADAAASRAAGELASGLSNSTEGVEADCVTGPGGSGSRDTNGDAANGAAADGAAADGDAAQTDTRTVDQVRADIFCDLLLGGAPVAHGDGLDGIAGHVQVTVPARTLLGAGDEPALLAGYGPIDADTARRLAANTPGCDRIMTDPFTGAVLAVERYRWNRDIERFLRARDERCRFPGCRRAARRSDIDHTVDAALGGPTRSDNLAHLCRRHHTLKHHTAWTVTQRAGGVLEWRSPTGRTHLDRPPSVVRFVLVPPCIHSSSQSIDGDPPPF